MRLIETCLGGAAEGPIAQLQLGAKHASLASFTPRLRTWWTGSGTPVGVLSDDGQRAYTVSFDPYGNRTVVSGGASPWFEYLPFGYKSGIRITGDGLVKFGLRWYLPVAGGWTQEDTLDPSTPATRNVTRMLGTIRSIIRTRTGASTRATTPHPSTQGLQSSPEVCSDLWEQRTAAFSVERLASRLVAM
ncbi:hypothetical protein DEI92_07590 [Curtobacterium sp. MCBD17_034]|uniref:hypothetical protein n=1 Tax=unclassified Curtobacterium TaxID=257496 RepID=UPI000DA7CA7F|nr:MULTISPECIES: hypothetical protein [unclassified Curtobacterium]PZF60222.1 hypothetical protein DEI92_07590 [Curtobacterium sp. MCBD17_034]PZM34907.1 hypothetical protein DEI90_05575 [Curtobacterium sp. MCBD17_031]